MKKINLYFGFLLIVTLTVAGCASGARSGGSKKGCGCGAHKGYVGY